MKSLSLNKKAETTEIFLAIAIFAVGVLIGHYGWQSPQAFNNCPEYTCDFVDREANYSVIGKTECSGQKGLVFGTDKCSVRIKNIEQSQSARYTAVFSCKTVDLETTKISNEMALSPNEERDFETQFSEAGGSQWKCTFLYAKSTTIKDCNLKQK